MSTELVLGNLTTAAAEINTEHAAVKESIAAGLVHALRAGELLAGVKTSLAHGEFEAWIEQNCDFSARTAQAYMRVARELPKAQRVADLSFREALGLLAEPQERAPEEEALEGLNPHSRFIPPPGHMLQACNQKTSFMVVPSTTDGYYFVNRLDEGGAIIEGGEKPVRADAIEAMISVLHPNCSDWNWMQRATEPWPENFFLSRRIATPLPALPTTLETETVAPTTPDAEITKAPEKPKLNDEEMAFFKAMLIDCASTANLAHELANWAGCLHIDKSSKAGELLCALESGDRPENMAAEIPIEKIQAELKMVRYIVGRLNPVARKLKQGRGLLIYIDPRFGSASINLLSTTPDLSGFGDLMSYEIREDGIFAVDLRRDSFPGVINLRPGAHGQSAEEGTEAMRILRMKAQNSVKKPRDKRRKRRAVGA